jgi:hypothetical protein
MATQTEMTTLLNMHNTGMMMVIIIIIITQIDLVEFVVRLHALLDVIPIFMPDFGKGNFETCIANVIAVS